MTSENKTGRSRRKGVNNLYRALPLLSPFIVLYLIFIVLPTVGIILKSFTREATLGIEILNPGNWGSLRFTFGQYIELFGNDFTRRTIINTVVLAGVAVAATTIIGTLVAYELAVARNRFTAAVRWIISLPVYLPSVVVAFSLLLFLGPNGLLNSMIRPLTGSGLDLAYSPFAVAAGMTFVLLPIHIRVVSASFGEIPQSVMEASYSLGAGELKTLVSVIVPIALPSILAALILNFAFAVGMVEIALIVGGGGLRVPFLPVEILQRTMSFSPDVAVTSAMSAVLIAIALTGQAVSMAIVRKGGRGGAA
jgi:ABC-type spermidine/putrescine transport system permease subunit I